MLMRSMGIEALRSTGEVTWRIAGKLTAKNQDGRIGPGRLFRLDAGMGEYSTIGSLSGAIVPKAHYRRNSAVRAVMIEVNRALYMDEQTGMPHDGFGQLQDKLRMVLQDLIRQL